MRVAIGFALAALVAVGCSTNSKPVPEDLKKTDAPQPTKSASDSKHEYGSSAMSGQAAPAENAPKGPADIMNEAAKAETSPSRSSPASNPAIGASASAAGLSFQAPAGWIQSPPSSQMRAAQFALPGADLPGGKGEAPELVLFFFGAGQGGTVDDNISRWIGQVTQPDGSPSSAKAKTAKREVGPLKVTTVVVDGSYASGGMMGGPKVMKENQRLWGAVIEGAGGPWFWKGTGPKAAMEAQAANFDLFLGSLHAGQ